MYNFLCIHMYKLLSLNSGVVAGRFVTGGGVSPKPSMENLKNFAITAMNGPLSGGFIKG